MRGFEKDPALITHGIANPVSLEERLRKARDRHLALFVSRIRPLFDAVSAKHDPHAHDLLVDEVQQALDQRVEALLQKNQATYSQAALKLVATPLLVAPVTLGVLGLPHILLAAGLCGGGLLHLNNR